MNCKKCKGKGYREEWQHYGASTWPIVKQCCDIAAYSARVRETIAKGSAVEFDALPAPPPKKSEWKPCQVIQFPKR